MLLEFNKRESSLIERYNAVRRQMDRVNNVVIPPNSSLEQVMCVHPPNCPCIMYYLEMADQFRYLCVDLISFCEKSGMSKLFGDDYYIVKVLRNMDLHNEISQKTMRRTVRLPTATVENTFTIPSFGLFLKKSPKKSNALKRVRALYGDDDVLDLNSLLVRIDERLDEAYSQIVQSVERRTVNAKVVGSSPTLGATSS